MVYKSLRGWTSGRSLPVLNFVKYTPGIAFDIANLYFVLKQVKFYIRYFMIGLPIDKLSISEWNQPWKSVGAFQNWGVCGQVFPSFPSPTALARPFCSCPIFRASWMRKLLLAALYFVWLVRERLLRRNHWCKSKGFIYSILSYPMHGRISDFTRLHTHIYQFITCSLTEWSPSGLQLTFSWKFNSAICCSCFDFRTPARCLADLPCMSYFLITLGDEKLKRHRAHWLSY